MAHKNKEDNTELNHLSDAIPAAKEVDTAGKSLSEALEISFVILKVIMFVLIIAFFVSGFKTVAPGEEALVLRFGKIRENRNGDRVLTSGPHWILPYPIDEIIKIPVAQKNLAIDSFWYYQTDQEKMPNAKQKEVSIDQGLNPVRDGYCITRSESKDNDNSEGSDYNIVHTRWELTYRIANPELFYTNVQIPDIKQSDIYDDVIQRGIEPLLQGMFEDIVVTRMVDYTIDEAITSKDRIPSDVKESLQIKLDAIDSGIEVISVQLTKSEPPRQVKKEFEATTIASNNRSNEITQARTKATNLLNETAGPLARQLYDVLHDDTLSEKDKELLWSQVSGNIRGEIEKARTYATTIVENAKARANYQLSLLPEFMKRPDIVIIEHYYPMMEKILSNAEEKFTFQSSPYDKDNQLWINLNKDPLLKSMIKKEKQEQNP